MNYQFWRADVAVVPRTIDSEMMAWDEWQVYAPPMIIDVLSPSNRRRQGENTPEKIARQRIIAMSNGTREFWVIDADQRTVHVTSSQGVNVYGSGELIPVSLAPGRTVSVEEIFAG